MITIDGARGEGGGQVLRSALALSMATGRPLRIVNIRAGRPKPGLLAQHMTCVAAACAICGGRADGARLRARSLEFVPGPVRGGEYRFEVGTAGSAGLVLQTVLPVLLTAREPSRLVLTGGTHNTSSPPFDFLQRVFLPTIERLGPVCRAQLVRHGFYPAGGGEFHIEIDPVQELGSLELTQRVDWRVERVRALVAKLPLTIAERELAVSRDLLRVDADRCEAVAIDDSRGPGNVVMIELAAGDCRELTIGFGRRGVPAETVARDACAEAQMLIDSGAPVGEHLADQLLLPLSLGRGGRIATQAVSSHSATNLNTIAEFLKINVTRERRDDGLIEVGLSPAGA